MGGVDSALRDLRKALSEPQWAELSGARVSQEHLVHLLVTWRDNVKAVVASLDGAGGWDPPHELDDYIGCLSSRDFILEGVEALRDAALRHAVAAWLEDGPDREFREHTEDALPLIALASNDAVEATDAWWWHRAPAHGSLRDGIEREAAEVAKWRAREAR